MAQTTKYAAILDAGSGGTRPYLYSWQQWENDTRFPPPPPTLKLVHEGTKVDGGIDRKAPEEVHGYLTAVFTDLTQKLTELEVPPGSVPIFMLATAGVRDVGATELAVLVTEVEKYLRYLRGHPRCRQQANAIYRFLFPIHPEAKARLTTLLQKDADEFGTVCEGIQDILFKNSGTLPQAKATTLIHLLDDTQQLISSLAEMKPLLFSEIVDARKNLLEFDSNILKYLILGTHEEVYEHIQKVYEYLSGEGIRRGLLADATREAMSTSDTDAFNLHDIVVQIGNLAAEKPNAHPRLQLHKLISQLRPIVKHVRKLIPGEQRQVFKTQDIMALKQIVGAVAQALSEHPYERQEALSGAIDQCGIAGTRRDNILVAMSNSAGKFDFTQVIETKAITGEEEGLYGWIAANYLRGNFSAYGRSTYHTAGYVEMGGASAQIAFQPTLQEKSTYGGMLWNVEVGGKEFDLYLKTLPLGSKKAAAHHHAMMGTKPNTENPAHVNGFRTAGKGLFTNLEQVIETTILNLWRPYEYPIPANYPKQLYSQRADLLEGAMEIDFEKNTREFAAGATFWDTTQKTFGKEGRAYGPWEFLKEAHESYAETARTGQLNGYQGWGWFAAGLVQSTLYRGFGFPTEYGRGGRSFTFQPYEGGVGMNLTWTIGRILLYATGSRSPAIISCVDSIAKDAPGDRGEWKKMIPVIERSGKIYLLGDEPEENSAASGESDHEQD